MIGIGVLVLLVAIGTVTAIRGRSRLSGRDYVLNLIGVACALAGLALQIFG